jgi:HEAT repeat protein
MKPWTVFTLTVSLSLASLQAATLSQIAAEAARYESGQPTTPLQALDEALARSSADPQKRAELEQALLVLLRPEATLEAKLFACQRLSIVGTEACVPALRPLLRSEDTVGLACLALANIPHRGVDRALREALPELRGNAQVQVIATLGSRRDGQSSRALSRIARGERSAQSDAALLALARIADRTARRTLEQLRQEAPAGWQAQVAEASLLEAETLAQRGEVRQARELYERLLTPNHPSAVRAGALDALLRLEPGSAEERIHRLLRGDDTALQPDAVLRPVAIAAVGRLQSATAGLVFAGELDRLPTFEQVLLIEALADLGPACPRRPLAAQLRSPSPEVRLAVIRAFSNMNDPADLPVFVQALAASRTPPERQAAEQALVQLPGDASTDQALLAQWAQAPSAARPGMLQALARRGSPTAIPVLFESAKSPEPAIARAGLQGLGRLAGPAELPALLDLYAGLPPGAVRDDAEGALAKILGRMPDAAGRSQAVSAKLSAASTPAARLALIGLLPLAGGAPALEAARGAAASEDPVMRDAGVRALAQWKETAVNGDLLRIYQEPSVPAHRALALRGLVRLAEERNAAPDAGLVTHYRSLLDVAADPGDRQLILGALGGCAHPDALKLALEQRSNESVRAEADQAVRRIAEALKSTHRELAEDALKTVGS